MTDYRKASMTRRETWTYRVLGVMGGFAFLWIFYRSAVVLLPAVILSEFFVRRKARQTALSRQRRLRSHFCDFLSALTDAMKTGRSLESSLVTARDEMEKLHGASSDLTVELTRMVYRMQVNRNPEDLMDEFASRSGIPEIELFAKILRIGKRRGGNMIQMISDCSATLRGMMESEREITVILTGKIQEKRVMEKIPVLILLYVSVFSPETTAPLYEGPGGRLVMTVAVILYVAAWGWGERIVERTGK